MRKFIRVGLYYTFWYINKMCLNKAKCNVKMEFFQILFWQKRDVRSLWRSSATTITRPVSCVTYPRPPPPVPLQDVPCLHPRPCMHWFLDFSYCSFHGDSESNGWKISNFVFSFNNVSILTFGKVSNPVLFPRFLQ